MTAPAANGDNVAIDAAADSATDQSNQMPRRHSSASQIPEATRRLTKSGRPRKVFRYMRDDIHNPSGVPIASPVDRSSAASSEQSPERNPEQDEPDAVDADGKPIAKKITTRKRSNSTRAKACLFCKRSHMTCDGERPCGRCNKRGVSHMCSDDPNPGPAPPRNTPRKTSVSSKLSRGAVTGASGNWGSGNEVSHSYPTTFGEHLKLHSHPMVSHGSADFCSSTGSYQDYSDAYPHTSASSTTSISPVSVTSSLPYNGTPLTDPIDLASDPLKPHWQPEHFQHDLQHDFNNLPMQNHSLYPSPPHEAQQPRGMPSVMDPPPQPQFSDLAISDTRFLPQEQSYSLGHQAPNLTVNTSLALQHSSSFYDNTHGPMPQSAPPSAMPFHFAPDASAWTTHQQVQQPHTPNMAHASPHFQQVPLGNASPAPRAHIGLASPASHPYADQSGFVAMSNNSAVPSPLLSAHHSPLPSAAPRLSVDFERTQQMMQQLSTRANERLQAAQGTALGGALKLYRMPDPAQDLDGQGQLSSQPLISPIPLSDDAQPLWPHQGHQTQLGGNMPHTPPQHIRQWKQHQHLT